MQGRGQRCRLVQRRWLVHRGRLMHRGLGRWYRRFGRVASHRLRWALLVYTSRSGLAQQLPGFTCFRFLYHLVYSGDGGFRLHRTVRRRGCGCVRFSGGRFVRRCYQVVLQFRCQLSTSLYSVIHSRHQLPRPGLIKCLSPEIWLSK